jgi:hypothetical protein
LSNKDQIEFGDQADRLAYLIGQNKELKELVISKDDVIGQLKTDNLRMERELQNLLDPLSKNSQLKTVIDTN